MIEIMLQTAISNWILWLALAPLAVWLGYRVRIAQVKDWASIGKHLAACLLIVTGGFFFRGSVTTTDGQSFSGGPPAWVSHEPGRDLAPQLPMTQDSRRPRSPPAFALVALDVLFYALLASAGMALAWSRQARNREHSALLAETELARARLLVLQMQLSPHFLFNALNGISSLIHTDPCAADDMVGDLSGLLRTALDTVNDAQVPLWRELEILDCYLRIEQRRFGERLHVERAIQPGALNALVPTLVLQPLLENSVKHGVERQRRPVTIKLSISRNESRLRMVVADNGPGLLRPTDGGVGLSNTCTRLQQLYPSDHQVLIQNADGGGCVVTLDLPYLPAGPVNFGGNE